MVEPLSVDDAFAPPGEAWHPVSPRLATARRITMVLVMLLLLVGLVLLGVRPRGAHRRPHR